jgi:glycosyltransferase involved in cell wall biosynthesis
MPEVLIDVTRLLYRHMRGMLPTGIDRVAIEYVRHFGAQGRGVVTYRGRAGVLPQKPSARAFAALLNGAEREPVLGAWLLSRGAAWDALFDQGEGAVLLNLGHYGLEREDYAASLRRRGVRPVVFVHDLIPITHPQYCRPGERERHVVRTRTALSVARGILVNSRDTLEQLRSFASKEGLVCPPALVAPLASPLKTLAPGPRPIDEPYFVMLATIEPRKNHRLLLEVWRKIARQHGNHAPRLLVIGQRGWECQAVLRELGDAGDLVIHRTACSDAELATALRHARALLMPSFVEGYGIPVVEALSLGVPAIASDLAVFREFADGVPEYLDPRDSAGWTDIVMDYAAHDSARRAAQLARLAGYRAPTWAAHFTAVEGFLDSLPQ